MTDHIFPDQSEIPKPPDERRLPGRGLECFTYELTIDRVSDFPWRVEVFVDGLNQGRYVSRRIGSEIAFTRWGAMWAARRMARRYMRRAHLLGKVS
jgi:hypothetical protein